MVRSMNVILVGAIAAVPFAIIATFVGIILYVVIGAVVLTIRG